LKWSINKPGGKNSTFNPIQDNLVGEVFKFVFTLPSFCFKK